MNPSRVFPRLTPHNHLETSPNDLRYNCVAWALEDKDHWWEPGRHWRPIDWPPDDVGLGALDALFRSFGFEDCGLDWSLEPGFLKVALYATAGSVYTHAARQLPSGKWTSKLGGDIDIEHADPEVVAGGSYGDVHQILKRSVPAAENASN